MKKKSKMRLSQEQECEIHSFRVGLDSAWVVVRVDLRLPEGVDEGEREVLHFERREGSRVELERVVGMRMGLFEAVEIDIGLEVVLEDKGFVFGTDVD